VLLAIHERRGVPQLISTDRHVSQGGVELESAEWNAATTTLSRVSLGPPGTEHSVYPCLPQKHPWVQADPFLFYDFQCSKLIPPLAQWPNRSGGILADSG
jgi:hypothetical protein